MLSAFYMQKYPRAPNILASYVEDEDIVQLLGKPKF